MIIQASEYENMDWNIHSISNERLLLKNFPELANIFKEFLKAEMPKGITLEKMIMYIVYIYHKRSPLVRKINDVLSRKEFALILLGLINDGDTPTKEIEGILYNESEVQVDMIFQFLYFQKDMNFLALMTKQESYMNFSKSLYKLEKTAAGVKKQTEISEQVDKILQSIDKLSEAAFYGDTELKNQIGVQKIMADRAKPVFPEENAAHEKSIRAKAKSERNSR